MNNWRWHTVENWIRPLDPVRGAEIGVKEGRFISHLLRAFPDLHMYAVDPWEQQPAGNEDYAEWNFTTIYQQYRKAVEPMYARVTELQMYSIAAARHVSDESLDFAFIDAQHDKASVTMDIMVWLPKIRAGGRLCGHDYVDKPKFRGVVDAVDGFFGDRVRTGPNDCWMVTVP